MAVNGSQFQQPGSKIMWKDEWRQYMDIWFWNHMLNQQIYVKY